MATLDLDTYLVERLQAFDSTIETGVGSLARTTIIDPVVRRLGVDVLDTDPESFLERLFQDALPDVDVTPGRAVRDLLIHPSSLLLEVIQRVSRHILSNLTLLYPDRLSDDEADALVANFFYSRAVGEKATGTARLYYRVPQSSQVSPATVITSSDGLRFFPTQPQSITLAEMALNQEGALYYFDVTVAAEAAGTEYGILADSLSAISGVPGVVRVNNPDPFTTGRDRQTTTELLVGARAAITTRTLTTRPGIQTLLPADLPADVQDVEVVGARDPEMLRDIVRASGPLTISGIPGGIRSPGELQVAPTDEIHLGGHTDIYVTQREDLASLTLTISELSPTGRLVGSGTGYTAEGGITDRFHSTRGRFTSSGIQVGTDYLHVSAVQNLTYEDLTSEGGVDIFQILEVVSETELRVYGRYPDPTNGRSPSAALLGGLAGVGYEIVRVDPIDVESRQGILELEPTLLAALDPETDLPALTTSSENVTPTPGSATLAPLETSGGLRIAKTVNIGEVNLALPALRFTSVEILDPLDLEPTGREVGFRHPVDVRVMGGITAPDGGSRPAGGVRVYFLSPTQFQTFASSNPFSDYWPTTTFYVGEEHYHPRPLTYEVSFVRVSDVVLQSSAANFLEDGVEVGDAVVVAPVTTTGTAAPQDGAGRGNLLEGLDANLKFRVGDLLRITLPGSGEVLETRVDIVNDAGTEVEVPNNPFVVASATPVSFVHIPQPYLVDSVTASQLTLDATLPVTPRPYRVEQGTTAAAMEVRFDGEFYYVDIVVEGATPSTPTVASGAAMNLDGYRSQGYELVPDQEVLALSVRERPFLRFTEFVDDHTRLLGGGAAVRITYEHASHVQAVQDYVELDQNRPPAEDILVFHALPAYVRLSAEYSSGIAATEMKEKLLDHIRGRGPEEDLTSYGIQTGVFRDNGAETVTNPIELVSLNLFRSRRFSVVRSEDRLDSPRGRRFLPDTGAISLARLTSGVDGATQPIVEIVGPPAG